MINKNISYYFNSSDSRSRIYYNFDHILELIASDTKLSEQTDMVRKQTTEKAYKEEKHRLPMIAPSGIFDYRNDDPTSLRQYSNLLVLDFDDFGSHEAAGEFKERLIQYANPLHLYAVWFSPGNKGVKAAMVHDNTNPEHHYNLFRQVKQRLYPRTDEFDKSCHNLSRTFFLSHDPEVYVNPEKDTLIPYHFEYDPSIPEPAAKSYNKGGSGGCFIHTPEEIEENTCFQRLWKDSTLINYVDRKWRKEYPDSYEDGNRHKSILSRAKWLCLYGVLYDAALDYLIGTFGRYGISEDDIEGMAINNYNANRGTFGISRMELYSRKERGIVYRNRMLRENTPFQ